MFLFKNLPTGSRFHTANSTSRLVLSPFKISSQQIRSLQTLATLPQQCIEWKSRYGRRNAGVLFGRFGFIESLGIVGAEACVRLVLSLIYALDFWINTAS